MYQNEVIPLKISHKPWLDPLITVAIQAAAFAVSLLLQYISPSQSLVSMIFVLAVFLISLSTHHFIWGMLASLTSVLIDNFVFVFPHFAFDFLTAENFIAAVVLLTVAFLTSALTTRLKSQERIKAETEKEKMRANLLRAISHDLRTPLTTIYGSCSAIIEGYDSLSRDQQLTLLNQMREDSDSLVRMVENLLSITRMGGGGVRIDKSPTVLEELIDATLTKFRKHYPRQDISVTIPDDFISIRMDAMLIQQVLINLLENAVLHAKGMHVLSLSVCVDDCWAIFEITDDGCGIPRDRLPRLFTGQLYTQETVPSDAGRSGMGIGLSVCSTIIKAHGGDITAENCPEGGARFRFRLEMEKNTNE